MKIEETKVSSYCLEYRDYLSDKPHTLTVTVWPNGEGFIVELSNGVVGQTLGLSHADKSALMTLLASLDVVTGGADG